ncbi:MAG: molybdopterin-dependent oxidoreductase [Fastidiosipila sp.]|nr:molybdopterin-dependent oxidoreductase [Fastidiosipila sp.]
MGIRSNVKRQDAIQKATGSAKYVEDLLPINTLYAKVLHSTIANGIVSSIDISEAERMDGVEAIITCFDVPKEPYATAGHPKSLNPNSQDIEDRHILSKRVRYYGDEIAAVAAVDPITAQKAVEAIKVEYKVFPAVFTPEAAFNSLPPLNEEYFSNELARMDFSIKNNIVSHYDGKFSTESYIAGRKDLPAQHFHLEAVHACHIEPNSCFAYQDGEQIVIVTSNQVPFTARKNIAKALQIPIGRIRVVKPYMGGGFGNKQDTLYEPIAALLSMKAGGRCVSLIMTREECFVSSRTRHGMDIYTSMEFEGSTLSKQAVRINANGGSYAAHGHAVSAYAVTNYFQTYTARDTQIGESSTMYTNLPSAAALRAYGIPQIAFAMESQMDDAARENGIDPIEIRKKNMMMEDFVDPFDKFVVKSNGLNKCIDRASAMIDWYKKRKEYDEFNQKSTQLKKGIGMAIFSYKTGVYPLQLESGSCRILMNEDGTAQIQVGCTDLGQGSDTVMAQIVSEVLTIPEDRLTVKPFQDTDITPYDAGAYASRQTYVSGGAAKKAALTLKNEILNYAEIFFQEKKEKLDLSEEYVVISENGERLASIADIACRAQYTNDQKTHTKHLTSEETYTCFNISCAFGTCFVDLEVDVPLGKIKINEIVSVQDSGIIINPQLAEAQMHGGIAMAIGYALSEQLQYDSSSGRMLNNNFLDYKIPTSMDIPDMKIEFVETYEPSGPFGNKGLAEPPTIAPAPAIRNAILHATGVPLYELPMTPEKLVAAFVKAGLIITEE